MYCKAITDNHGLCAPCWHKITFIIDNVCDRCGATLEYVSSEGICGACLHTPPPYQYTRSVMGYNTFSKYLILKIKYGDATQYAKPFAAWLHLRLKPLLDENTIIVPVPLHWTRLWKRRYNQAALISGHLAQNANLPHIADLLVRHRRTATQGHKSFGSRFSNVTGSIKINNDYKGTIKGRRVVIVDDVITSGATMDACSRALLRNGAREVIAAGIAQVNRNRAP